MTKSEAARLIVVEDGKFSGQTFYEELLHWFDQNHSVKSIED